MIFCLTAIVYISDVSFLDDVFFWFACRKEWSECISSVGFCDYVLFVVRSHSISTAATGQKRKSSSTSSSKEECVFDYQEDEFLVEVMSPLLDVFLVCYCDGCLSGYVVLCDCIGSYGVFQLSCG